MICLDPTWLWCLKKKSQLNLRGDLGITICDALGCCYPVFWLKISLDGQLFCSFNRVVNKTTRGFEKTTKQIAFDVDVLSSFSPSPQDWFYDFMHSTRPRRKTTWNSRLGVPCFYESCPSFVEDSLKCYKRWIKHLSQVQSQGTS